MCSSDLPEPSLTQGGVVGFPLEFDSGLMRGRFSPVDGQLYVTGLKGWVSSAVQDGCLQRVRYTGLPVDMPVAVRSHQNGLAITFSRELDLDSAEDPDNYSLEAWNYRYAADYGSPDLKLSDPLIEGHDEIEVRSATLLDDRKTVFLEIPGLQPANQVKIGYQVATRDGRAVHDTLHYTLHSLAHEAIDAARLHRRVRPGQLAEESEARLRPGVHVNFHQLNRDRDITDARTSRMLALHVEPGERPSLRMDPGPFAATFRAYLRSSTKSECTFAVESNGAIEMRLNDAEILRDRKSTRLNSSH